MEEPELGGDRPRFVYVTYISTTPEKVWQALTDPSVTPRYWQHVNLSDWKTGSRWEHRRDGADGEVLGAGKVVESRPPHHLVVTWGFPDGSPEEKHSRVTFQIEEVRGIVRLTVTHDRLRPEEMKDIAVGWPQVLASLKSMLETGKPLPTLW
jgi:uncharacterized protein YndB with AHSA1/START domain